MAKKNPPPVVEVTWRDTFTTDGWEANKHSSRTAECWSVGYLLKRDDEKIVLAGSWSTDDHMSKTTIPIGCVRSVVELKK